LFDPGRGTKPLRKEKNTHAIPVSTIHGIISILRKEKFRKTKWTGNSCVYSASMQQQHIHTNAEIGETLKDRIINKLHFKRFNVKKTKHEKCHICMQNLHVHS